MGLYGAIIGGVIGGGAALYRNSKNNKHRNEMIRKYEEILKKGGTKNVKEQNALLANLAALKGDESAAGQAEVASSEASRQLRAQEGQGAMGVREGMFSGEGADRAAAYASDAVQEDLGRYASQADIQNQQARYLQSYEAMKAFAKREADKQRKAKTSGLGAAAGGVASGMTAGAGAPI